LVRRAIFILSILAAVYCLYCVISFWMLEDISTPEQMPRIHSDILCYSGLLVGALAVAVLSKRLLKKGPGN
jgi:hypothetical protein